MASKNSFSDEDKEEDDFIFEDDEDCFNYDSVEENNVVDDDDIAEYNVLDNDEILKLMKDEANDVLQCLSLSRTSSAFTLLRYYNWKSSLIEEEFFNGEESLHRVVNMLENSITKTTTAKDLICKICYEEFDVESMTCVSCGDHYFCNDCWAGYIHVMIDDGSTCLLIRCPEPSCNALITDDTIQKLTSAEDYSRYTRLQISSFVENRKQIKWCPYRDCDFAVQFFGFGSANYNVTCKCGHGFCFYCAEEIHRPLSCKIVERWNLKNRSESESLNWIIAYTKPCPKCNHPIEKNDGCMHMTCTRFCRQEFCWICLGPWKSHGTNYYNCNKFPSVKENREDSEEEKKKKEARKSIKKYTHYYSRWAENGSSMIKAIKSLRSMEDETKKGKMASKKDKIMLLHEQTAGQMKSIAEAWTQIIECRRFLRWSYVYGYYLPDEKVELFQNLQSFAESALELLHHCAEIELKVFIETERSMKKEFEDYRQKLVHLTDCTKKYFKNLTQELEKDLLSL